MLRVVRGARCKLCLALFVLASLAGCSSLKIVYDRLDRLALNHLQDQITLTDEQSSRLKQQLANIRQWHCRTQVQLYARWLRAVNDDIQTGNAGVNKVEARYGELQGFWRVLMEESAASLSGLVPLLSDAQVEEFFKNAERDNAKLWVELLELSAEQRRARAEREMQQQVERWIGDLSPTQEQALRAWSADANAAARLEARATWQQGLRRVLLQRADAAALRAGLRQLLVEPERGWTHDHANYRAARRQQTLQLLTSLSTTLTPAQRRKFAKRSDSWADDFDELACSEAGRR